MNESEVQTSRAYVDRVVQVVDADGGALPDVWVTRVASNGTYLHGVSDSEGQWKFADPFRGTSTVLAASSGYNGTFEVLEFEDWATPTLLALTPLDDGGSVIFQQGTGYVPGLSGRLNPIRDAHNRFYIYGDNISFDEQPNQPHRFVPGEEFTASDSRGAVFGLTILTTLGRTTLLRYRRITESPLPPESD